MTLSSSLSKGAVNQGVFMLDRRDFQDTQRRVDVRERARESQLSTG